MVAGATKAGMKPILTNSIQGFVEEPDMPLAENAIMANMKLIEGVVATYPDDHDLLLMAAMARANYAFGFIQDEVEAVRIAYPGDSRRVASLMVRLLACYASGRAYAERALAQNDRYAAILGDRRIEIISREDWETALSELGPDDAEALFWLAFTWGGSVQVRLDPAEAVQLPKIEAMVKRVLELDDHVFFDIGAHLLAGVLAGFRAPALGGNMELASKHLQIAAERGGVLLPKVLEAQFVYAQTEQEELFQKTLLEVIEAEPRKDRGLFEVLAKKKACRLLANIDQYFLTDAKPVPEACYSIPFEHPLRAEPLAEVTNDEAS